MREERPSPACARKERVAERDSGGVGEKWRRGESEAKWRATPAEIPFQLIANNRCARTSAARVAVAEPRQR
jgi:hypothetical protein